MKKLNILQLLIFITLFGLISCKKAVVEEVPADGDGDNGTRGGSVELDGRVLYASHCLDCHGNLLDSEKTDATTREIRNSIIDVVRMNHLSFLTDDQILALSLALSSNDPSRISPQINSGAPSGAYPSATSVLNLEVTTDMRSICYYSPRDVQITEMTEVMDASDDGRTHTKPITLSPGASYRYYVHCKDAAYGNVTKVSQLIQFSTDLDAPDTTPPFITNYFNPGSPLMGGTETLRWYVNTSEISNCRYSTDSSDSYAEMNVMLDTGFMGHSQVSGGFSNGNTYNFYVICADLAGNISPMQTVSFTIGTVIDGAQLWTNNCMGCHGSLNGTNKRNSSAQEISDAIRDVGRMQTEFLEFMSNSQLQALEDVL